MKKAIVTGANGQDGSYLCELLLNRGYKVYGTVRRSSTNTHQRISADVLASKNFELIEADVADCTSVTGIVNKIRPDEIYNLAAQSHVKTSFDQPDYTFCVDALGPLYFLEAIRQFSPDTKFYQASTSEMFGKNRTEADEPFQDENTPFEPQSPYAIAKVAAHQSVGLYRRAYDIFGCCGILFNHESERRGETFVTRKITKWIGEFVRWTDSIDSDKYNISADITPDHIVSVAKENGGDLWNLFGPQFPKLRLGNLDAHRDWGHAQDYVYAMYLMMQQETPEDFVICTGETYTIREFLDKAFGVIGCSDWNNLVVIDPKFYRPAEVDYLRGSPEKAKNKLGWDIVVTFDQLVKRMVINDLPNNKTLHGAPTTPLCQVMWESSIEK